MSSSPSSPSQSFSLSPEQTSDSADADNLNKLDLSRKVLLTKKLSKYIDLNTDYGQSRDKALFDNAANENLLAYVTSVNIPCCVHDGDPAEILRYIKKARQYHCAVGAHIAYPDPQNFGYKDMDISTEELEAWLRVQMGAFGALLKTQDTEIEHVRPHGALYGRFIHDLETALTVGRILYEMSPWVILVGPAGSILEEVHKQVGIRIAPEIYLGKRYAGDGRIQKDSFHESIHSQGVLEQTRQLVQHGSLTSMDGRRIPMNFRTLHISPQMDNVVDMAQKLSDIVGQPVPLPVASAAESGWI